MKLRSERGYIIIIVSAVLAIISIVGWAIVNLGCGEILQTRGRNDMVAAQYVAIAGAELMYAKLKSQEGRTITWPQTISQTSVKTLPTGGTTVGTFTAIANTISSSVFGIISEGIVNGRHAKVTVKYGMSSPFTNGYPMGAGGSMSLAGNKWFLFRSWVRAEGPIAAGGGITSNNYVQVSGDRLEHQTFETPSFWYKWNASSQQWEGKSVVTNAGGSIIGGDVNGDGQYIADTNGDGAITVEDCQADPAKIAIFNADNTYSSDGQVNDKDAFYTYYTSELNAKENLQIGPGQAYYYTGDQNFGPSSVPAGTQAIFVNGKTNILFSDTQWWGVACNHVVISMDDIAITQPCNGSNDTLTLVSYGDVDTGGVNLFARIQGNFVVYAKGDFGAYYGGSSNGTIFAEGNMDVDTVWPIPGLLNRDLNKGTVDWASSGNWPLGLPPNYNRISLNFSILNETTAYKARIQKQ